MALAAEKGSQLFNNFWFGLLANFNLTPKLILHRELIKFNGHLNKLLKQRTIAFTIENKTSFEGIILCVVCNGEKKDTHHRHKSLCIENNEVNFTMESK